MYSVSVRVLAYAGAHVDAEGGVRRSFFAPFAPLFVSLSLTQPEAHSFR